MIRGESLQGGVGSRAFQNARAQKKLKKQAEILLPTAFAAYSGGRHADAQTICLKILQDLPDYFDALHLLGICKLETGRLEEARQILERAIAIEARSADAYSNLGFTLFRLKRYQEARVVQEKALALKPNFPTALTNLGNTLMRLGLNEQAIELHERAMRMKPDYADAYCNRGMAEMMLRRFSEAAQTFERALSFRPRHLEALVGKALVNLELRHFDVAEASFNEALSIKPDMAELLAHRGRMYVKLGQFAEAEADFDAALALAPHLEPALRGKAGVGLLTGRVGQAIVASKNLLQANPRCEIGLTLFGACLANQGDIAGAIAHFDAALVSKPDYEDAITKKIFYLDFLTEADFAAHQAARNYWWRALGASLPQRALAPRSLDPDKRIVVGYVSSDFRSHSAAFAFTPVLQRHDHSKFKIIGYSCSPQEDANTVAIRGMTDGWVEAWRLSDDELADRVQADEVDILVDLSGHTAGHRLAVFARKPAPIQVTAWGSGTGTGLPTMDYFFADPVTVPEAVRPLFAEKIYDLPSVITMEPITELRPSAVPMLRNGYVTFGVFNRIDKISDDALKLWAELMLALPGAKIIVKHGALDDEILRNTLVARFVAHGIAEADVTCLGATTRGEHLTAFEKVDISLDPFPQNGGISTWESLYMGVPVVTKLGNGASSRAAAAIIKAVGLDDWVASDRENYIAIAKKFAASPAHLERLRAELRAMISSSSAGNVEVYTRKVEEGYRQFWRDYCGSRQQDAG